jgi:hypothetical protein
LEGLGAFGVGEWGVGALGFSRCVNAIERGTGRRRSGFCSRAGGGARWAVVRRRRPGEASRWMVFAAARSPSPANGPLLALLNCRLHQPSRSCVTWRLGIPSEWVTG